MDCERMGRLISALRRERGLTQKALAGRLKVTDKAVSKWERGLCCPDIALLGSLAAALGVTVEELLAGERNSPANFEPNPPAAGPGQGLTAAGPGRGPSPCRPARRAAKDSAALRRHCALGWVLFLLAGVLVCGVCDLCTGGRGWALYPALCCALAGAVSFFLILQGARGIFISLLLLSGLAGPFLAALDRLIGAEASILPVGLAMAGLGLALLWGCYGAGRLLRARPLRAGAACAGLCMLACLAANLILAWLLNTPLLDGWDLLALLLLGTLAAVLLWLDRRPARRLD